MSNLDLTIESRQTPDDEKYGSGFSADKKAGGFAIWVRSCYCV